MKKSSLIKSFAGVMFAGTICMLGTVPAFAAGSINYISLKLTNRLETGEILEPEISCRSNGISIDSVTWNSDVEKWKPGKKVTATVVLSSDDGNEFLTGYNSSSCRVSGGNLTSAKGSGTSAEVKVSYLPVVELDSPDEAGWSVSDKKKAVWRKADYATAYQIRLYRDDDYLKGFTVTGTSKDLSQYMTKEGHYYYEIRSIGKTKEEAKYRKASEYLLSSNQPLTDLGDTDGRWRIRNDGKRYRKADGNYVVSQWYRINDQWYYFDSEGYALSGWILTDGKWYYLGEDGVMLTGWQKIKDIWYYLHADGSMAVGWVMAEPGKWYYMNPDGSMAANAVVDGKHLDSTGYCVDWN